MATYRIESIRHDHVQYGLTIEEAAKFLRLSERTTEMKAIYHEAVRGAWYVTMENVGFESIPKERMVKDGFSEEDWNKWSAAWYAACDRIAEYAGIGLAWGIE